MSTVNFEDVEELLFHLLDEGEIEEMTLEERVQILEKQLHTQIEINQTLQERVSCLERIQQRAEDERGYAEQGSRYSGKHPRSCACNRCLGIR